MNKHKSIRSFIGAKDFIKSSTFYKDLGFKEIIISEKMTYFEIDTNLGFYLQNYYLKDWIDNSMLFLEVVDVEKYYSEVKKKKLSEKFKGVRLSEIVYKEWGCEFFLHDPSGVLWHFGKFN